MSDRNDRDDDNSGRRQQPRHRRGTGRDGENRDGSQRDTRKRTSSSRDGQQDWQRRDDRSGQQPRDGRSQGGKRSGDTRRGQDHYRSRDDRDAPRREWKRDGERQRPRREGGSGWDRDQRSRGDRDQHSRGDRGQRPRGDREQRPRSDRDQRPQRERNERWGGDRSHDRRFNERGSDRNRGRDLGRGGTRGGGRSDRGGRDREFTEAERLQHELRPVRAEHDDPVVPDEITQFDLNPAARNELKTLQPETQEWVARHLAMVNLLLNDDPELAHQHAISASRRGGRIPVARETLAITAFHTGDYALSLRELRTYRRLTGSQGHLALMVECERALGRPERGIETGLSADKSRLTTEQRVYLAIAMSGARLDLGQVQQALFELEIPELDPSRAFSWSGELFDAYATVLEDLGRVEDSALWKRRAEAAYSAIAAQLGDHDQVEVFEVYEHAPEHSPEDEAVRGESEAPDDGASAGEDAQDTFESGSNTSNTAEDEFPGHE